jgi:hypothetical protein
MSDLVRRRVVGALDEQDVAIAFHRFQLQTQLL